MAPLRDHLNHYLGMFQIALRPSFEVAQGSQSFAQLGVDILSLGLDRDAALWGIQVTSQHGVEVADALGLALREVLRFAGVAAKVVELSGRGRGREILLAECGTREPPL